MHTPGPIRIGDVHTADTYGHEAGDLVLYTLGAHFSLSLRQCDIPCRHGGEEFLVLLPATDGDSALAVLQKLCRSVEGLVVRIDATRQAGVTISAGVATFPADGVDADALLRSADGALYRSKHVGRNQVARAPALAIAVADTGIGIAQGDLPTLSKPLTQLDAALAREHGGVGLSLALARRLAAPHGGKIEVESEHGKGSTFTLRLPIEGHS